jgi:hypothetical protein
MIKLISEENCSSAVMFTDSAVLLTENREEKLRQEQSKLNYRSCCISRG